MLDSDVVIDTLQKLIDHGHGLFGYCLRCERSFDISVPALIAGRGGDRPVVRMKPVRCPRCGAVAEHRITAPSKGGLSR